MNGDGKPLADAAVEPQVSEPRATIDAWIARGAHGFDPVRFRFIEAMAKRTAAHGGDARRILDARLASLLAKYGNDLEQAGYERGNRLPETLSRASVSTPPKSPRKTATTNAAGNASAMHFPALKASAHSGPLAELVDHIARRSLSTAEGLPSASIAGQSRCLELQALSYFRRTWSRLSVDQRLTQSRASLPENAGPLNSQQLVHRSLTTMRELSPEYLSRFMSYVDVLMWLDQVDSGAAVTEKNIHRDGGHKKRGRGGAG